MPKCFVIGCRNNTTTGNNINVRYYSFPKSPSKQAIWLKACGKILGLNVKNAIVCSIHFTPMDMKKHLIETFFNYSPRRKRKLKFDAIPSMKLPSASIVKIPAITTPGKNDIDLNCSPTIKVIHAFVQHQKVKLATQLFSRTVAKAITYYGNQNALLPSNWNKCSEVILLINNWFDLLNSQQTYGDNSIAYGLEINEQNKLLDEMDKLISTMLVHTKMPFQKGILITNMSIRNVLKDLKSNYGLEYIITRCLNQDVLENFFSFMGGMGGANTHPNPLDFKYRFISYVLGKHSSVAFTSNRNTGDSVSEEYLLNAIYFTDESNLLSVFTANFFQQAEILDFESINTNLNNDIDLLNSFDLEMTVNKLYDPKIREKLRTWST